jgi:hypothetical protein
VLRSVLGAATATALLSIAPPVQSLVAAPTQASDEVHPEWGSTKGKSGVLRRGCKKYAYAYSITPPSGDWALEVTIRDPDMESVGGGVFLGGFDPQQGTGTYTVCKNNTRYGRFTIEAKLSADNGPQGYVEGSLPTSHFRLHRPRR